MSPGLLLLILRVLMGVALFAFLIVILVVLRQDLRRQTSQRASIPAARLVFKLEPAGMEIFPLSNLNLIGRAADNTIVLNDEIVSAHHARLSYLSGWQWWLEDLGSRNGTSVNGISVEQPIAVTDGDEITFGTMTGTLVVDGASTESVPEARSDQKDPGL